MPSLLYSNSHLRWTDAKVGIHLIRKYILVHLPSFDDKFRLLTFVHSKLPQASITFCSYMIRKLYALVHGDIGEESSDSTMNHELLLPGHLYTMFVKVLAESTRILAQVLIVTGKTTGVAPSCRCENKERSGKWYLHWGRYWRHEVLSTAYVSARTTFPKGLWFLLRSWKPHQLSIGNGKHPVKLWLGFNANEWNGYHCRKAKLPKVIISFAAPLNEFRYLSHFRCVHRGSFFAEMKTTSVRKLLPESWGFLCPVHTPDGAPCGLLNHLSGTCKVLTVLDLQIPWIHYICWIH